MNNSVPIQHEQAIRAFFQALRALFEHAHVRQVAASLILFAVSSMLILPNLGYPRAIIFDETYYITQAQKYLNGVFFLDTHPPLGKLLIAAGERWLHPDAPADEFVDVGKIARSWPSDLDITGYRLMPALFGMLLPILVFLILTLVLKNEWYSLAVSVFVAMDNALIVQSRAAMLDSFLIFFCLASLLVLVLFMMRKPVTHRRFFLLLTALWGILQACAANVKLSGAVVLVLTMVYALRLLQSHQTSRLRLFGVVFVLFFVITYLGLWQVHFSIARQINPGNDYGIMDTHWNILTGTDHSDPLTRFVVQLTDALAYHIRSSFNVAKLDLSNPNEIGSPWYWWLVGGRAVAYRWETFDGVHYQYVYLLGNPITWLASLLGVIGGTMLVVSDLLFRLLHSEYRRWLYVLVLLYWAYMAPMIMATRVTYLHHYLLPMILGVMLFGIILWQTTSLLRNAKRNILIVGILLLIFAFWVYKPLTYSDPLTHEEFQQRNIFPAWNLKWIPLSNPSS